MNNKILIIDDDSQIRKLLKDRLEANGYHILQAENGSQGVQLAEKESPDLILLDLNMPQMNGLEVLSQLQKKKSEIIVIIMTAYGTIERAVEAMKLGAYDFLPKPCKPDHILIVVKKALERKNLKDENLLLRREVNSQYRMVTGESAEMKKIMETVQKTAQSKTTVLIEGESGTGKQLLARAIHSMSNRSGKPFVQVNCTTLSEQLMESDLFGHEKGSFTGAVKQKKGRFELAHGGTVFLDEIGELSPSIQAKLLHVLEYGEFQRVGGVDTQKVDVRIITATNKNLRVEVEKNRFREDLFYRLNVLYLKLPSLRDRKEDIPVFASYFLQKHSQSMQKNIAGFSAETINLFQKYTWPGNIRELENVIERAVVLADEKEITPDLIPSFTHVTSAEDFEAGIPLDQAILQFKKQFIKRTLQFSENNQTRAAELLDIQRTYLNKLIKELGVTCK